MSKSLKKEIDSFLKHHSDVKAFDVLIPDMNGVFRGKRVTLEKFKKISSELTIWLNYTKKKRKTLEEIRF